MKKILAVAVMSIALTLPCSAFARNKVLVPAAQCDEIVGFSYSTGGGDNMIQYAKILCKKQTKSGLRYFAHMPQKISKAGMLGKFIGSRSVGRLATDDTIEIVITNEVDKAKFD